MTWHPLHPIKLQSLIEEYSRLRGLQGYTPQSRGQRLNSFIAELLQCWGIQAIPGVRGNGEIDVGFELNGRHFVVEAKWEDDPIGIAPIAKLQKRLRQRLGGTTGLFLSMSGFSPDAIKDLKQGEQLALLLLSREHLEAMLSGFVPPDELISLIIRRASFYGESFVRLQSLFETTQPGELGVNFGSPDEIVNKGLVKESIPGFKANVVVSNLPFGQSGVAELSENKVLLTLNQGIYIVDYNRKNIDIFIGVPGCSRNVLVPRKGTVFIVRKAGVGCLRGREFSIVGGGFCGNVCLFKGRDDDIWVFSNGLPGGISASSPMITKLGNSIGDEKRYEIDFAPSHGTNAVFLSEGYFIVIGTNETAIVELGVSKQVLSKNLCNPMGLARLSEDRFVVASNGVILSEVNILRETITQIARLNLQGSVSELAESADGGGYLFSHYTKTDGKTAGLIIRWQY